MVNYANYVSGPVQFDPLGAYQRGKDMREVEQQRQRRDALQEYARQNAGALLSGDRDAAAGYVEAGGDLGQAAGLQRLADANQERAISQMYSFGKAVQGIADGDVDAYNNLEAFAVSNGMITREQAAEWDISKLPQLKALAAESVDSLQASRLALDWAKLEQDATQFQQNLALQREKLSAGGSQPNVVREYEFARQNGFQGSFIEYQQQRKGNGVTIGPDGTVQVGGPAKPFNESQSKTNVYAVRAKGALDALEPVAGALTSIGERALNADPTGIARGAMQTDDFQVAQVAGQEFLQAILRKDTGAAITEQEQVLYGRTYLPQPGDNPAALQQKAAARRRAIAAIESGMSPAQMVAAEQALGGQSPASPQPTVDLSERSLEELMEMRRQMGGQ